MTNTNVAPNHHAHHAPFAGVSGVVAALSMITGREASAQLAIELSGLAAGETVLDIGCGPGAAARRAARLGATVIGVDPAAVMLRFARALTRGRAVSYRPGSAEQLPVRNGEADVAWSIATVHHWRDVDDGLEEVRRALAPGGRFVAIERRTQPGARGLASHGWTRDQAEALAERCTAHGFVDVRVEQRPSALAVIARTSHAS